MQRYNQQNRSISHHSPSSRRIFTMLVAVVLCSVIITFVAQEFAAPTAPTPPAHQTLTHPIYPLGTRIYYYWSQMQGGQQEITP